MARLLQRVGSKGAATVTKHDPAPRQSTPEPAATKSEPASEPEAPAPKPMLDPREMSPRALPPELSVNLSAMRELANMNAHAAIATHLRRTVKGATGGKVMVALAGWVVGLVLVWLHLQGYPGALYGAAACLTVGMTWTGYCLALVRRLKAGHSVPMPVDHSTKQS
jgi:hypothetical protein